MNVKQNMFLIKKIVARFDKKIVAWQKKSIDDPREESITADPEEHPITEDSNKTLLLRTLKRTLSMKNLKRTPSRVTPKDNCINEDPQEPQNPQYYIIATKAFLNLEKLGKFFSVSNNVS